MGDRAGDPGTGPDTRQSARPQTAAPVVVELFERWETELRRISGKGKLAEAIRFALRRRKDLGRFLDDGRIEIDFNINIVDQAPDHATIATLLASAKLDGVDPYAGLKLTFERIADGWPNRDIDALMPWNHVLP